MKPEPPQPPQPPITPPPLEPEQPPAVVHDKHFSEEHALQTCAGK
ncbi:hypothetical protein [Prosthecobacter sp.]